MRLLLWVFLVSLAVAAAGPNQAAWPQFRGPEGSGVGDDAANFPSLFGPNKALRWKVSLPAGHGSPAVWRDAVFVTASDTTSRKLEVIAVSRRDGAVLWRHSRVATEMEKVHALSSAATSTPITDGERIYAYFGSLGLFALDMNGKPLWEFPMEVAKSPFGSGISPVLAGDFVIITRDYPPQPYMMAVRRSDGKLAWKVDLEKRNSPGPNTSHATPLIWKGRILLHRTGEVSAHSIEDGRRVWWIGTPGGGTASLAPAGNTVLVAAYNSVSDPAGAVEPSPFAEALAKYDTNKDGKLTREEAPANDLFLRKRPGTPDSVPGAHYTIKMFFGMVDANKDGNVDEAEYAGAFARLKSMPFQQPGVFALRPDGEGDVTLGAVVWKEPRNIPEVPAPLAYRGRAYTISNGGVLSCLDAETGKIVFRGRVNAPGAYFASPVAAGGRIVTASADGIVTVLGAGGSLEILGSNDLGEPIYGTPAPVESTLYVRSLHHLWAFGEK